MPYIFIDDGAPEASDYDSNYVFLDEAEARGCGVHWRNAVWRRVTGWWCAHPVEPGPRH